MKAFTKKQLWMLGLLAVVLVLGAYVVFADSNDTATDGSSTPQLISPSGYQETFQATERDHTLLDVRTAAEFNGGHIPGAANISVEMLAQNLDEVPRDKPVVVYCRSGNRSAQAAQILDEAGYTNVYDLGGIITWAQQGYPVQ